MALETRHLRLVTAIAGEGSVTRAAAHLHLTQSALSHQLRDVEGRLGARLFLRLGKRMVPTPAGERVLATARPLLVELARVEEEVGRLGQGREGLLRLATECYTCYHWIPAVLRAFKSQRPRVEVQIVAEATRQPIEALLAGRIDVAIGSSPVRNRRLRLTPLFDDEMVAVVSPDHPLASRPTLSAADFRNENLILYCPPSESTLFERVLRPAGVRPREVTQIQLTEAIVELVKAGFGVTALARWAVAPQLASGELRAVPLSGRGLRRRWYAAILRDSSAPEFLTEFVDLLSEARLREARLSVAGGRPRLVPAEAEPMKPAGRQRRT